MSIEKEPYQIVGSENDKSARQRIEKTKRDLLELREEAIPLTPRQKQVIKLSNQEIEQFARKYQRSKFVKPEIFYLRKNDYEAVAGERISSGSYLTNKLTVCLKEISGYRDETNLLDWTGMLCHELLHAKAYQSIYAPESARKTKTIHSGISLSKPLGYKTYFQGFNEAITVQLTQYIVEQLINKHKELYKEELEKIDGPLDEKTLSIEINEYKIYRLIFKTVVGEIAEIKNKPVHEISDSFINAYFNGDLKEMAKLVDETYGYGTFRLLGNLSEANAGEILKFLTVDTAEEKENIAQRILNPAEFAKFKGFRKIMYENKKTNEEQ